MDEKLSDKMDNYLKGRLSAAERQAFEAELSANEALRSEFETHKQLVQAVEMEGVQQLLNHLHEKHFAEQVSHQAGQKGRTVVFRPRRTWAGLAAAASVALLLALGWWWQQPASQQALYDQYYSPAIGLPTTLGISDDPQFVEGMISYKLGEYAAALENWRAIQGEKAANDTLQFYQGMAHLAIGEAATALEKLQPLAEPSTESAWQSQATWYAALAWLKQGEAEKARPLLQRLNESTNPFAEKSGQLLEELEGAL